jgi:hypothetical protein
MSSCKHMFNFVETPARNAVNDVDHLQIKNLKYMINGGSSDFAEKVNAEIALAAAADQKRHIENVMADMGHQQRVNAIAAAVATEQKPRRIEAEDQKPRRIEAADQKSSQVVQTQTNSIMVGFQVKPDNKYLDHHRVNRINNLLETFQTASCSFLLNNANHVLDTMFDKNLSIVYESILDKRATVVELDCNEALRMVDVIYDKGMISLHGNEKKIISPMLTLGYGLFKDMVLDTCDTNNKITRESMSEAANALLKVACNVPQF